MRLSLVVCLALTHLLALASPTPGRQDSPTVTRDVIGAIIAGVEDGVEDVRVLATSSTR